MRDLPRSTRLAIATLYGRHRDARRIAARTRALFGGDATPSLSAGAAELEAWNALQAVLTNIHAATPDRSAHEFVRLMALRGRALTRAA